MSSNAEPNPAVAHIEIPRARRRRRWPWATLAVVVLVPASLWATGFRPKQLWSKTGEVLETVAVDRGDVEMYVVENGSLESANNATAKCMVEALMGLVGGTQQGQMGGMGGGGGGNRGGMGGGGQRGGGVTGTAGSITGQGTQANAQALALQQAQQKQQQQSAAAKKPVRVGGARSSAAAKTTQGAGGSAVAAAQAPGGMAPAAAGAPAAANGAGGVPKPMITSFTMVVQPHLPLRPTTPLGQQAQQKNQNAMMMMGGGGGGNRGGGMGMMDERAGSTRIISILPEGTWVKEGEKVCELDSSAFRDELTAQEIRYAQAESWVEQAKSVLKVSEIALQEYKEGTLIQDRHLIDNYIAACRNNAEQAKLNLDYSQQVFRKGLKTPEQLRADENKLNAANIALKEALGMKERLERFSAPRILKNLEAKIEAVRSDVLAQQSAFELEKQRRAKLKLMIDYCTMRAPRDGIVVYAAPANTWGRPETVIREGITVRQGQDIFKLPDPNHMRVRARINESKISMVHPGLSAMIKVDAFPDRPMTGKVAEVTPIPSQAMGPISDVKIYYAMVDIDTGGFAELKPGLSAEVGFAIDVHKDVLRVPVKALRWVNDEPYAAVPLSSGGYVWRKLNIGLSNPHFAEVLEGLQEGERVIADPSSLTPPKPAAKPKDLSAAPSHRNPRPWG